MLLHEQHADLALLGGPANGVQQSADDHRSQPEGELVGDECLGPAGERTGQGEHLLLAAGEQSGLPAEQRCQLVEQIGGLVDGRAAEAKVLGNGEVHDHRSLLRHEGEALARPLVQRSRRGTPVDPELAGERGRDPTSVSRVVDFPAPLGPSRTAISPDLTSRSRSWTTAIDP